MMTKRLTYITIIVLFLGACKNIPKEKPIIEKQDTTQVKDSTISIVKEEEEEEFYLTEENAIDFFFNYQKTLTEDKVKVTTNLGSFTVQLYDNVPYHKANFIYLTKKEYFNNTMFHRVVKNFIIQGGNSDNIKISRKRRTIGKYLLPPDSRKGHKHHRGTISMPSSEIDNPHMLASPYEFFIVVTNPGSYHLDGNYTPFGKVIEGMNVVDLINQQPVDKGDWPSPNIYILKAEVVE
ncbi:MAG: peptidylprolyl isomerase [Flavobacteriaceae bacterium]|nr:MAG: peptidylprolyl isomerase [Flavobacteriaceae bacterium]